MSAADTPALSEVLALQAAGEAVQAIERLRELVARHPEFAVYRRRLQEAETAAGGMSVDSSRSLLAQAREDLAAQRHEAAYVRARQVLAQLPGHLTARAVAERAAAALDLAEPVAGALRVLSLPAPPHAARPAPRPRNPALPPAFEYLPVIGAGNDYRHILERASLWVASAQPYRQKVSIVVPVYNRHRILANTLAALTHQTYPTELTEVIVVDDGSSDAVAEVIRKYETRLNLYYIRQRDSGFRVAAARNLGLRAATGEAIVLFDADILPCPGDVEAYMRILHACGDAVLIGHRRYVDVSGLSDDEVLRDVAAATSLPDIQPKNDVASLTDAGGLAIDWRYPIYERTDNLLEEPWPFRVAAGGNLAFSRSLLDRTGLFDEDFQAWGGEDTEFAYRLGEAGAYFVPMREVVSLHQEPLEPEPVTPTPEGSLSFRAAGRKVTVPLLASKCPAPTVRKPSAGTVFAVPKVSIAIVAREVDEQLFEAIESGLAQDLRDQEVCVGLLCPAEDGGARLEARYGDDLRLRWIALPGGTDGQGANAVLRLCRGMYIAQLGPHDRLHLNALRACVGVLDRGNADAVYTDFDFIGPLGTVASPAACAGDFDRAWLQTGMIATGLRVFRRQLWARTSGCDEAPEADVDFDLWLQLAEHGRIRHAHAVLYSRRLRPGEVGMVPCGAPVGAQADAVRASLERAGLQGFWAARTAPDLLNPLGVRIEPQPQPARVDPADVVILIPSCQKYAEKARAVRETWARDATAQGWRHFFLMGDPTLRHACVRGDTLWLPCRDDYESLLLKLVLGYAFVLRHLDFAYVYKIDDDSYPELGRLAREVLPQLPGTAYAGGAVLPKGQRINNRWHVGKCADERFDTPYPLTEAPCSFAKGGYGYFLRRDALAVLAAQAAPLAGELEAFKYSFEDLRIAQILAGRGIAVRPLEGYSVVHGRQAKDRSAMLIYEIPEPQVMRAIHAMPAAQAAEAQGRAR